METLRFLLTTSFYPPYHIGGDAIHVLYLANALQKKGHEVHILHSLDAHRLKRKGPSNTCERTEGAKIHTLKHPFGRLGLIGAYIAGRSRYFEKEFRRLVNEVKPDVVHHHNISLLGRTLFQKIGSYQQLYTAHDYWLICQRNDLMRHGDVCRSRNCFSCAFHSKRPPQLWRNKMDTSSIDCIISPSHYLAARLDSVSSTVKVLHNFVPEPPNEIRDSGYKDFFLFLGVLEPHKGVKILLEAFTHSKYNLVIGGQGSLGGWVEQVIRDRKLSSRIHYLKWIKDKWPYIDDTWAVIIPSLWLENCPLVALEAFSVGRPVFCSDLGGTKEIVKKVSPNLVIPYKQVYKCLRELEPPDIPQGLIKKVFKENFSEEVYMEKYMEIAKGGCLSTS